MLLLALDTSTHQASIALCSEEELFGEYSWYVGNNHSVELLHGLATLNEQTLNATQQLYTVVVANIPAIFAIQLVL